MLSHKTSVTKFKRELSDLFHVACGKRRFGTLIMCISHLNTYESIIYYTHSCCYDRHKRKFMLCSIVCDNEYFLIILSHIPRRRKNTTYQIRGWIKRRCRSRRYRVEQRETQSLCWVFPRARCQTRWPTNDHWGRQHDELRQWPPRQCPLHSSAHNFTSPRISSRPLGHAPPPTARVMTCALRGGISPSCVAAHNRPSRVAAQTAARQFSPHDTSAEDNGGQELDNEWTAGSALTLPPLLFPIT